MSVYMKTSSPAPHNTPRHSRTSNTPLARPSLPGSVGQAMPPLMTTPGHGIPHNTSSKVRSPSPNYFGFQTSSSKLPVSTYDGQHPRQNWSPPSSAVRSTAAFSPTFVPVDQNPDFAAFRRQSEGIGRTFSLSGLHTYSQNTSPTSPTSEKEKEKVATGAVPIPMKLHLDAKTRSSTSRLDPDVANLGRSPKRHLSSDSTNFPDPVRKPSPAIHGPTGPVTASPGEMTNPPLFALPPPPLSLPKYRAETLPGSSSSDRSMVTPQHVVNLMSSNAEDILILDLRVSTQYAKSRITGALNLCIPTTLMKRPSFNVAKLADTFKTSHQRSKFESWSTSKYIIVYDATASQLKDASIGINTIKKFESEGYQGIAYIIKGGFVDFARKFPAYVDRQADSTPNGTPNKLTLPDQKEPLPVIGGCPMPATKSAANPFFGNIRQNMDLIGGVGQMPVKRPANMSRGLSDELPLWLNKASHEADHGAEVSDKFLRIEKREQKRMHDALSGEVSYGTPSAERPTSVKIAGIEKGSKNRYNNIWPFEHSRVKLEGVPDTECDYVNANHIQSSLSNKRYIATQGPIPATFADFWNVVWQQDVRVIVMLTAEKEGGQIKAHDYWSDRQYGPFRLEQLASRKATLDPEKINRHRTRQASDSHKMNVESKPDMRRNDSGQEAGLGGTIPASVASGEPFVTVRRLTLSHEAFPFEPIREITHLQYASWPDFGAPAHPTHLLGLVEQCDSVIRSLTHTKHTEPDLPSARPIVVHCSAGCGRTGTFCTVDSVIDMLKRQRNLRRTKRDEGRQGTPMDVDGGKHQFALATPASKMRTPSVPSNPFFSSPMQTSSPVKAPEDTTHTIDGKWVTKQDQDLIEKTVEDFRHQRLSMVQSLRQFVLCYETVMEWLVEEERREMAQRAH